MRIGIIGHSLGGAAALLLSSQRHDIAAVMSIGSFSHSIPMLKSRMRQLWIPYWPLGWSLLRTIQARIGTSFEDIAPRNTIKSSNCPVLLIHGEKDLQVSVEHAYEIFNNCGNDKVRLWILPGGEHLPLKQLRRKSAELLEFLG